MLQRIDMLGSELAEKLFKEEVFNGGLFSVVKMILFVLCLNDNW